MDAGDAHADVGGAQDGRSSAELELQQALTRLEEAEREARAAEEASRRWSEEADRLASTVDGALDDLVAACRADRDRLQEELTSVAARLGELEAMKARRDAARRAGEAPEAGVDDAEWQRLLEEAADEVPGEATSGDAA
jgi:chromosome segregation ATPase